MNNVNMSQNIPFWYESCRYESHMALSLMSLESIWFYLMSFNTSSVDMSQSISISRYGSHTPSIWKFRYEMCFLMLQGSMFTGDLQKHKRIDHWEDADKILDKEWSCRVDRVGSESSGIEESKIGVCRGNLKRRKCSVIVLRCHWREFVNIAICDKNSRSFFFVSQTHSTYLFTVRCNNGSVLRKKWELVNLFFLSQCES